MKKLAIIAGVALCLCSCGGKKTADIYREALSAEIVRLTGADAKVRIDRFERMDSTTFGQELEHRMGVFAERESQNRMFHEKYTAGGMPRNAEKKRLALIKDAEVRAGLESIAARLAESDSLDVVAYYDYRFSGKAVSAGCETVFEDYYATITPDGKVLSINNSAKGLHRALGRVIPGYAPLVGLGPEEE